MVIILMRLRMSPKNKNPPGFPEGSVPLLGCRGLHLPTWAGVSPVHNLGSQKEDTAVAGSRWHYGLWEIRPLAVSVYLRARTSQKAHNLLDRPVDALHSIHDIHLLLGKCRHECSDARRLGESRVERQLLFLAHDYSLKPFFISGDCLAHFFFVAMAIVDANYPGSCS
jgi:hypothetical protein